MKQLLTILLLTGSVYFLTVPCNAQVIVEETITTDTVDIFAQALDKSIQKKSPRLAMWANILVPGLGHQYLGKNKRAFTYFTTEALLIFGMVFTERYSKKMFENSRSYAWKYAATTSKKDPENEYWKILGNKFFLSAYEFNNVMELNGEYDEKYVNPDELWYWENEIYQENYREIRKIGTRFHIASSFFLGAMILNRAVSFIDVRLASKYRTVQGNRTNIDIHPHYSLSDKEIGVYLTSTF